MRCVLDTNVIVSSFVFGERLAMIRGAWNSARLTSVMCDWTIAELRRVLRRPKFKLTDAAQQLVVAEVLAAAEIRDEPIVDPALIRLCRDPNDCVPLALAIEAGVMLVSGDGDLISLRDDVSVQVLRPGELVALLSA